MTVLKVDDLRVHFPIKSGLLKRTIGHVKAVDGVSIELKEGETYGLVGESGSGKTTTGRAIIGLNSITSGEVMFNDQLLSKRNRKNRELKKEMQMVFQDPFSSLNPRKRIIDIVAEPYRNFMKMNKVEERKAVEELLSKVGISKDSIFKYHMNSLGGKDNVLALREQLL